MSFESRSVSSTGPHGFSIVGDLTIRDRTRQIVLDAEYLGKRPTSGGERRDFRATGSLNRFDYGLRWNQLWAGRALVGETIRITLDIALIKNE